MHCWPKSVIGGTALAGLADQALSSASRFILAAVISHSVSSTEFGAFGLLVAVALLATNLGSSVFVEPMMVYSRTRFAGVSHYTWIPLLMLLVTLAATGFLLVWILEWTWVADALTSDTLRPTHYRATVLSAAGWSFAWYVRRLSFAQGRHWAAVRVAGFELILTVVLIGVVDRFGSLNLLSAIYLWGLPGVVPAGIVIHFVIKKSRSGDVSCSPLSGALLKSVLQAHWGYGRWSLSVAPLRWAPGNLPLVLAPSLIGLSAAGTLKVLLTALGPIILGLQAAIGALLPRAAELAMESERGIFDSASTEGFPHMRWLARTIGGVASVACVPWLWIGVPILFGAAADGLSVASVLIASVIPLSVALGAWSGLMLRARDSPQLLLRAYFIAMSAWSLVWVLPTIDPTLTSLVIVTSAGYAFLALTQRHQLLRALSELSP